MANEKKTANQKKINDSLDLLNRQVSDLYTTTYSTTTTSDDLRSQLSDKLDDAIKKSTEEDSDIQNLSNTSKIIMKLMKPETNTASAKLNRSFGKGTGDDISALFQDSSIQASLMDTYAKTKWITELDNEFDLICKYMPKLQVALDIKRDAVLCSDSYTKEFLNVRPKYENPTSSKNAAITANIDEMIKKYDLSNRAEKWYENTSKYGEQFVYCVPYSSAFAELMKRRKNTGYANTFNHESTIYSNDKSTKKPKANAVASTTENGDICIKVNLDTSMLIESAVANEYYLRTHKSKVNKRFRGLSESYSIINETGESFNDHLKKNGKNSTEVKFDNTIGDSIEWEDDKAASDGLIDPNEDKDYKINLNGAVLTDIKHDRIIPIYIDDILFGCYYIRYNADQDIDINSTGNITGYNSVTGMFSDGPIGGSSTYDEDEINQKDMLLRTLAANVSKNIDAAFINSNVDLKRELYLLLKFNDKYNQLSHTPDLDIVFIPSDDIHHLKFNDDPITHRGISDLWNSLVSAKQWIMLNTTSVLGWTTRGFDRRVYYVKQSLDTNTAQSLLNVVTTIKKGNFGIRQMESVNNILNIVGRFNDFVIPVGPNGEAPITFDTQAGQQFDFPQDLMGNLEESAVNATDVPLEIVNSSTSMDFAVRYTMTNAKLLRNVLKRQAKMEEFLSTIFTKIYKFEYNEDVELNVNLPIPAFLSMTQGSQLLQTAMQYADSITEIEMANEEDEAKQAFKKQVIRRLIPSYLSDSDIEEIRNTIKMNNNIDHSMDGLNPGDLAD